MREELFTNPRPVPGRLAPMLAGSALIVLALPVFAIAGWPLKGWALTAVLWTAAQALGYLLTRLPLDQGNLAASGVRGIGMGFRAFIVGIPLVAVTVADSRVGVAAVILYALAYTLELAVSLVTFFGAEVKGMKRMLPLATGLFLALPAIALAADETTTTADEKFDPLRGVDAPPVGLDPHRPDRHVDQQGRRLPAPRRAALDPARHRPDAGQDGQGSDRKQALGEIIYEIARVQVAEQGLPAKAMRTLVPVLRILMIFIWVVNMLGFIPLPLSDEKWKVVGVDVPTLAIFAATSTLSVTLALAFMTWMFTHIEGIRANGVMKYLQSWIPDVPKALYPLIIPLEILGQFMRLISLSVRLYANMLAGHMLILTFIGLIFLVTPSIFPFSVLLSSVFYLFEVVIVVSIQAYIFAALSAIYIGSAIEPEH